MDHGLLVLLGQHINAVVGCGLTCLHESVRKITGRKADKNRKHSPVLEKLFPDLSSKVSIIRFLSCDRLSDCREDTKRVKDTAIFSTFRSLTCVERFDRALPRWVVRGLPPAGLLRLLPE